METVRTSPGRSRFTLRTLMLAVAATATTLAFARQMIAAPVFPPHSAVVITVGLVSVGLILPSLWIGAVRRLSTEGHLAQVAGVSTLLALMISVERRPRPFLAFVVVSVVGIVFVPSVAWCVVSRMEPGEGRDGLRLWTLRYTKNALQLAFGFAFFMACFLALGCGR